MNKVRNFGVMLLVLLLCVAVFGAVSFFSKKPQKAHDFSAGTHNGQVISLYDNLGKSATVLIFIDPEVEGSNVVLEKLLSQKDNIDIIAVSVSSLDEKKQRELLPKSAFTIEKLCFEGSEAVEKYNIGNAPITYFIDKDGYVQEAYVGNIKPESIEKIIKKIA